jgi:pilus assembly protein CpaF
LVTRRVSFLVSGGTGAGKTTMLAALLGLADPRERILVVEDVRELAVGHPHVVHLEGRSPNVEGVGEVTMVTLLRQALRMRPDRIVVGEVRGAEVRELLAALNTGHEGGAGTVHANAAGDLVARLEALGALAGMSLPAVHAQLASAVSVVVHMRRNGVGRCVDAIGVVMGVAGARPVVVPVLEHHGVGSRLGDGDGDGDGDRDGVGEVAWDASAAAGAAVVGCDRVAGRARLAALVGSDVLP